METIRTQTVKALCENFNVLTLKFPEANLQNCFQNENMRLMGYYQLIAFTILKGPLEMTLERSLIDTFYKTTTTFAKIAVSSLRKAIETKNEVSFNQMCN